MREAQTIDLALQSMLETCDPEHVPEEREALRWLTARLIECQRAEFQRIARALDIAEGRRDD